MSSPVRKLAPESSRARRLVLFDIDGTILWTDGAGRRAVFQALEEHFGKSGPGEHRFDGKTDPQIVRELMRHAGVSDDEIDARLDEVLDRYLDLLRDELASVDHGQHIFPGVRELLDALEARGDVVVGLLTGNIHHGARVKLAAVGIDPDAAMDNLRRLQKEGALGPYGFYESIDYTAERLPEGQRSVLIRAFMTHHQGMSLVSLANILLEDLGPKRFHADPAADAVLCPDV